MAGVDNKAFDDINIDGPQPNSGDVSQQKVGISDLEKQQHVKINEAGKVKVPRKVLHCSDGVYEEYSTDEEEEEEIKPVVDPKTLTWVPYIWYLTTKTAFGGLAVCDYLGEKLAWFFGITSPRYQYAIDEVHRMQEEQREQDEQEREEREAELQMVRSGQATKNVNYGTGKTSKIDVNGIAISGKATD